MPSRRGLRPLKAWRYAGLFGPELLCCAAEVRIGPFRQAFWAVWDRARLAEATLFVRRSRVSVTPERVRVVADGLDLSLERGTPIEVVCPSGSEYAWTRKTPLHASGTWRGRPVSLRGLLDESAGYHARVTDWRWSAGVGVTAEGAEVFWNLVTGINDPPSGSERAVWVGGAPSEPGPVEFAADLRGIAFAGGAALAFTPEATRAHRQELGLFASDYEAPFGIFTGSLPGGHRLAEGYGVMERHRARW